MPEGEPHLECMFRFWLEGVEPGPNRTNGQSHWNPESQGTKGEKFDTPKI